MDGRRDVPEGVLFNILLFLPVISLLRFKAVCRSWRSIIESSTFIMQQLNSNSEKNNLIVCDGEGKTFMLSGRNPEVCTNLNLEGISLGFGVDIVASCNGILCLNQYSGRYRRASLWNPATKQVRELPESPYFSERNKSLVDYFALGFDVKTNDYKIVCVNLGQPEKPLNESLVQVYSMRTNSWRTIHKGNDFPVVWISYYMGAVCKNEMCLWIAENSLGPETAISSALIFYFDLTEEVYGTIPLPDDRKADSDYSLAFVNDKITCAEWNNGTSYCCYEIWMMNEFGMKESWSKLYKLKEPIDSSRQFVNLLYLSKSGDFILVRKAIVDNETGNYENEVYLYYLATGEVMKLDVPNVCNIKNYIESLVPI